MSVEHASPIARVLACSSVLMVAHTCLVVNQDVIEPILATALILGEASHLAGHRALAIIEPLALIASHVQR